MSQSTTSVKGVTRRDSTFIKSHASKLSDLPHPDEEWCESDVPDYLADNLRQYDIRSVIERVDDPDIETDSPVWKTTQGAWTKIQEYSDTSRALPCNHTGFSNTGEGEKPYECTTCGEQYARDALPY